MRLLCVAGFLGSGKTTVLLELARRVAEASLTLAIVENEIGEVGVDGGIVRERGLPVRELFGGCVCCTLQTGLVDTLRALAADPAPDWVLVEPTGLAAPADITTTVRELMPDVDEIRALTLVDAERWETLAHIVEPLITAQIEAADVIAITKVDLVSDDALAQVTAAVRLVNTSAPIVPVAATAGAGVQGIFESLIA